MCICLPLTTLRDRWSFAKYLSLWFGVGRVVPAPFSRRYTPVRVPFELLDPYVNQIPPWLGMITLPLIQSSLFDKMILYFLSKRKGGHCLWSSSVPRSRRRCRNSSTPSKLSLCLNYYIRKKVTSKCKKKYFFLSRLFAICKLIYNKEMF